MRRWTMFVLGWIFLGGAAAMARAAGQGRHRRGRDRVPARQRGPRAALPRGVAADGDRQHDRPRRQPARRLRRIRHGPPARTHGLQGHARRIPNVPKALRDHGASFNGTTNVDRTNYFETMPATDENLEFGIALEGRPPGQQLRQARGPGLGNDRRPQRVRARREQPGRASSASASTPPPTNGTTTASRPSATAPTSNACRSRTCRPSTRSTTSRTTRADRRRQVRGGEGARPRARSTSARSRSRPRKLDADLHRGAAAGRRADGHAAPRRRGRRRSAWPTTCPSASHADWAPLSLLGGIISQSPNGRLYKALVESKLATSAFGRLGQRARSRPVLRLASVPSRRSSTPSATRCVNDARIPRRRAVHRGRGRTRRRSAASGTPRCCNRTAQAMAQALSSASSLGDWRLLFIQRDRVAAVTAADVNRVAKTYFQKPNRTVGVYIPAKESTRLAVPPRPPIDTVVKDYKGGSVGRGRRGVRPVAGQPGRPAQGRRGRRPEGRPAAEEESRRDGLAGADAALRQRGLAQGPDDRGRDAARPDDGRHEEARPPGPARGTGRAGHPHLAGLGGGGRGGRGGAAAAAAAARRANSPSPSRPSGTRCRKALELLGEILREPAFPAAEFETSKRRMTSMLSAGRTEPGALAGNKLGRTLSPYATDDVRYVPTLEETLDRIEAVTLEQVKALYETQVGGCARRAGRRRRLRPGRRRSRLVKADARRLGVEGAGEADRPQGAGRHGRACKEDIVTPDKSNAEYLAGLSFPLSDSDPDYAALRIGNFIFGGSTLASRLGDRIRQKDGPVVRRHVVVHGLVPRSGGLADGDRQHQPGEHRQGRPPR